MPPRVDHHRADYEEYNNQSALTQPTASVGQAWLVTRTTPLDIIPNYWIKIVGQALALLSTLPQESSGSSHWAPDGVLLG